MKKTILHLCLLLTSLQVTAQVYQFGDTTAFSIRTIGIDLTTGTQELDLDCDGANDLAFEVIYNAAPPQLRRTAVYLLSPDSIFDIAVLDTYKVKNFKLQDTIQSLPPDDWTNFPFLVIGISSNGGSSGNCCFNNEYVGFRKRSGTDTLEGWIKISTEFFPEPKISIYEIGYRGNCPLSNSTANAASTQPKIGPNPFSSYIQVEWDSNTLPIARQAEWIYIYTIDGRLKRKVPSNFPANTKLDTSDFEPGIYFVQIASYQYKLIK